MKIATLPTPFGSVDIAFARESDDTVIIGFSQIPDDKIASFLQWLGSPEGLLAFTLVVAAANSL